MHLCVRECAHMCVRVCAHGCISVYACVGVGVRLCACVCACVCGGSGMTGRRGGREHEITAMLASDHLSSVAQLEPIGNASKGGH